MKKLDQFVYMNELLSLYGSLLTKVQQEVMVAYYRYNLSYGEIADNKNISRAAVSDAINKASKKLTNFEKKLNLHKQKMYSLEQIELLKQNIEDEETLLIITNLERNIRDGI